MVTVRVRNRYSSLSCRHYTYLARAKITREIFDPGVRRHPKGRNSIPNRQTHKIIQIDTLHDQCETCIKSGNAGWRLRSMISHGKAVLLTPMEHTNNVQRTLQQLQFIHTMKLTIRGTECGINHLEYVTIIVFHLILLAMH